MTKSLTLLRHAKSGWDDPALRDFDRPLNARGRKAARTMGRRMKALGLAFDSVIASPAARVRETLDEVERGYGRPLAPAFDRRLYLAPVETLLDCVAETGPAARRLLLVGHNPGLEMLALHLIGDDGTNAPGGLGAALASKYPTAALAEIALGDAAWPDIAAAPRRLARFLRPRDLDPSLGPDEEC